MIKGQGHGIGTFMLKCYVNVRENLYLLNIWMEYLFMLDSSPVLFYSLQVQLSWGEGHGQKTLWCLRFMLKFLKMYMSWIPSWIR